jgi:hypothetical protein
VSSTFTPNSPMPTRPAAAGEAGHVEAHDGLHDALLEVRAGLVNHAHDFGDIQNKPTTYPPQAHSHAAGDITSGTVGAARLGSGTTDGTTVLYSDSTWRVPPTSGGNTTGGNITVSQITDSTTVGRSVVTAASAAAARSAIGAGTSNLAVGTGATDAASGTHTHTTSQVQGLDAALTARLQVVSFGTTGTTARPSGVPNGGVYWIGTGTVLPANALSADLVYLP